MTGPPQYDKGASPPLPFFHQYSLFLVERRAWVQLFRGGYQPLETIEAQNKQLVDDKVASLFLRFISRALRRIIQLSVSLMTGPPQHDQVSSLSLFCFTFQCIALQDSPCLIIPLPCTGPV